MIHIINLEKQILVKMDNDELRIYIKNNFLDKNNKLKSSVKRFNKIDLIKKDLIKFKLGNSLIEKLYLFYYNINIPKCLECNQPVKFLSFNKQYNIYCSPKCSGKQSKKIIKKKYGVENVFQLEKIKEKSKQTKLDKYNNENYNNQNKLKKTNLEKYGVENVFQSKEIKNKIREINLEKYGVEHNSYHKITINKRKKTRQVNFYNNLLNRTNNLVKPLFSLEKYYNINKKYKWECLKCNTEFQDHLDDGKIPRCPTCYPKINGYSLREKEIVEWCKSLGLDIIENDRELISPYEVDIYLPNYNLAIEYNGIYYHSIKFIDDKWYHQKKVELAYRKGVRLLHVWEHEDIDEIKQNIQYYLDNTSIFIKVEKPKLYNIHDNLIWI